MRYLFLLIALTQLFGQAEGASSDSQNREKNSPVCLRTEVDGIDMTIMSAEKVPEHFVAPKNRIQLEVPEQILSKLPSKARPSVQIVITGFKMKGLIPSLDGVVEHTHYIRNESKTLPFHLEGGYKVNLKEIARVPQEKSTYLSMLYIVAMPHQKIAYEIKCDVMVLKTGETERAKSWTYDQFKAVATWYGPVEVRLPADKKEKDKKTKETANDASKLKYLKFGS